MKTLKHFLQLATVLTFVCTVTVSYMYALPPTAFDDTVSIDVGVTSYRTINLTLNDTDAEDVLDLNNIDLDPSTPGIDTSFTTADGSWYINSSHFYGPNEVVFFPATSYFFGTSTVQYVTVDSDSEVSNIATATIGSYVQAPTVANLSATGVDGERVGVLWSNFASMPGGVSTDNLDLDPLTPGQQSTSTTPLGIFTHLGPYIIFQSTNGLTGIATTSYQVFNLYDGQPSNIGEVTVTINPNTPPVANDYTYGGAVYPGEEIHFYLSNIGTDVNQGFFYVSSVDWDLTLPGFQNELTTPEGVWSILNNDPYGLSVYFRSAANFLGTLHFPFMLKDNSGVSSNIATTTINVVNDAPLTVDDSAITGTGVPVSINVFANDNPLGGTLADVDLDPSTALINETSTSTPEGTFTVLFDKKVLFTPAPLFMGTASVPYIAVDSFGARSITSANIQVNVRNVPVMRNKIGIVGSSNVNTTFSPPTTGPVSIAPIPATTCPAFAGTINSAQLGIQNFESNARILSEGETARGVIALENIGSAQAHTIRQRTTISSGSASSIVCIMKGDGTVLVNGVDYNEYSGSNQIYFEFLDTPAATLGDGTAVDGSNIAIIVFDIIPDYDFTSNYFLDVPLSLLTVTESVSDVANGADAFNYPSPYKDEALIFPRRSASTVQTINASSTQLSTDVSHLTVGEILTYRTKIEVPEGASIGNISTFQDTFAPGVFAYDDNGLQNPIRVTASTSIIDANTSGPLSATPQVLSGGNEIQVSFDAFQNTDTDTSTVESIIIEYDVIVTDSLLNVQGGVVSNNARHTVDTTYIDPPGCSSECNIITGSVTNTAATSSQIIVEPALMIRNISATSTSSTTAQFVYELFHDGLNTSDAQDVIFYLQTNGPGLTPITISNPVTGGLPAATTTIGSLFLSWPSIPSTYTSSSPITISFTGTLATPLSATTTLTYPVGLYSASIPGASSAPLSSFSPLSHGRLYSGTSSLPIIFAPLGGSLATSTPTSTPGCVGSCGGILTNPGCLDPKALNYDKWATSDNGSCKYPDGISPVVNPPINPNPTTPPTPVVPITPPVGIPTPGPVLKVEPTYIAKNKTKKLLEITGSARDSVHTAIRNKAKIESEKQGNSIFISKLNIDQPILQLSNITSLLNEAWILPDNSTPDKGGNTVIVGHSYGIKAGKKFAHPFFTLDTLLPGDMLEVKWKGKTYVYEVFDNDEFSPDSIWLEDDTEESVLTLYSCGRYTNLFRQVVRASLVSVK